MNVKEYLFGKKNENYHQFVVCWIFPESGKGSIGSIAPFEKRDKYFYVGVVCLNMLKVELIRVKQNTSLKEYTTF